MADQRMSLKSVERKILALAGPILILPQYLQTKRWKSTRLSSNRMDEVGYDPAPGRGHHCDI